MSRRLFRRLALWLLVALLSSSVPSAPSLRMPGVNAQSLPAGDATPSDPIPPAPTLTVAPVEDPHLPSLALSLAVAPDPLQLGETAVLTVTVLNQAPDPAEDLVITLPVPDTIQALTPPVLGRTGWQWNLGRLAGGAEQTLVASFQLRNAPPGDALAFTATAMARGLVLPVQRTGGVLVHERRPPPTTAAFIPGGRSTLRSHDGRVSVEFPPAASARPLTLRYRTLDAARADLA
jgi:hypothetical protein